MKNLYLVVLALLVGCAKQFQKDDNALTITAISADFDTKVSETAFESGDIIGVFIENNTPNLRYEMADGSEWKCYENLGEFKNGDNVIAYYPYSENATSQSAIEVGGGVDFMITEPAAITVADNNASAALKFKHIFGKLSVDIKMPEEIAGVKTVSLDSVVAKNVFRKATVNLTDGKISGLTDKGDLKAFGNEIIVIPQQTAQKIKLVFKMVDGTFDSLAYNAPITFESGKKTTLTATSNADLYFTSTINLSNGEAQADLPLSFYVAKGRTWKLTSSAPWLTVTPNQGVGAAIVKVSVTANNSTVYKPRTTTITLSDDKPASTALTVTQNYIKKYPVVKIGDTYWTIANLGATTPQGYGYFYKWGSTYPYARENSSSPSGHWGGTTTAAATAPTSGSGTDYDYGLGLSGCSTPGDPCASLGAYRTPTKTQLMALQAAGTPKLGAYQGVDGYFFGSNTSLCNNTTLADGCIFLPVTGYRTNTDGRLWDTVDTGRYWSSSVSNATYSYYFYFYNGWLGPETPDKRGYAFAVRCVAE